MTQFFFSTTGNSATVVFPSLGNVTYTHPATDVPIILPNGFISLAEYNAISDFDDLVAAGDITIEDENGYEVTSSSESTSQIFKSAKRDTVLSTGSNSFINYLTLNTGTIPAGEYEVVWHSIVRKSSTSNDYCCRVQADGSVDLVNPGGNPEEIRVEFKDSGSDQRIPLSGANTVTFASEGSHTITYDFRENNGSTAYTYFAYLSIRKVS